MIKKTFSLRILPLLAIMCLIGTGTSISKAASPEEPSDTPPEQTSISEAAPSEEPSETTPEPMSIHQMASTCWENFEEQFEDEPYDCQNVCDTCHTVATVIGGENNPEAYTTDQIFPEAMDEEANWNTIGLLQESCRNCHTEITEAEPGSNHEIFVEYDTGGLGYNFKATSLKLYDNYVLCTTCHSPHREEIALLRVSNQGSTLCLDCHST